MTPPVLRPMTTQDLPAILALEHALFGEESWSRQMLEGELAQQPASRLYLVASPGRAVDGQPARAIAGYGGLLAAGGQADVLTLAVAREHWGRGIGSALLAALLAEAQRRGCTEVFLEVRADNDRAQALYQRYGFTQIGIRKGYYQPSGADALVMRRGMDPRPPGSGRPGLAGGLSPGDLSPGGPGGPGGPGSPAGPAAAGGIAAGRP